MTKIEVQSPGASLTQKVWRCWAKCLCLAVLALVLSASCSGVNEVEPESFALVDARFAGIVEVDGEIWIAVNNFRPAGGAELRLLDDSGSTVKTVDMTEHRLHRGLQLGNGLIWIREDRPFELGPDYVREEAHAVLGVDPSTAEIVHEYGIPPLTHLDEDPFVVVDGAYLQPKRDVLTYIDLATGDSLYSGLWSNTISGFVEGDFLWLLQAAVATKISLDSYTPVATYNFEEETDFDNSLLKYYDGKFWIAEAFIDAENAYEYDLETGEYSNPVPRDSFPTRWFESVDSRWELFNETWVDLPSDPRPGDTWRRVDLETGKVIGEYNFGDYRPEIATDDYLWLTRYTETGFELGRLPLG